MTEHRQAPYSNYKNLPKDTKDEINSYLLREQGGICAYCMGRISDGNIRIEHYVAQSVNPALELNYQNMLGVCPGNEGHPYSELTCDKHRKNVPLTVNPLNAASASMVSYTSEGRIESEDIHIHHDLDEILNLNVSFLRSNRKAALDALKSSLHEKKATGTWKQLAQRYIDKLNSDDTKQPYCGILLWYLVKKTR